MAQVAGTLSLNAGAVTDQLFSTAVGDALTAAKVQHVYKALTAMGFAIGGTPTTREEVVFVASGTGTVLFFKAGLVATGSSTSITFDLKKNGSSILTSVITVTNANSARQIQDASISSSSFVDEDVFSIAMTVSSSTGAQGPICFAEFRENTSPS
jgi:hypothetical protein